MEKRKILKMDIQDFPRLTVTNDMVEINYSCTNKVLEKLRQFKEQKLFCDAVIYAPVGSKTIDNKHQKWGKLHVHSGIVASGSTHLQRTFLQGQNNKLYTFYVDNVDMKFVNLCVDFIYRKPVAFTKDEIEHLQNAAECFALSDLVSLCKFTKSHMNETNHEVNLEPMVGSIEHFNPNKDNGSKYVSISSNTDNDVAKHLPEKHFPQQDGKKREKNSVVQNKVNESIPDTSLITENKISREEDKTSNQEFKEKKTESLETESETNSQNITTECIHIPLNQCADDESHVFEMSENIIEGTPICISNAIPILAPNYIRKEMTKNISKEAGNSVSNGENVVKETQELDETANNFIGETSSLVTDEPSNSITDKNIDCSSDIVKMEADTNTTTKKCYVNVRNILNRSHSKCKNCHDDEDLSWTQPVSTSTPLVPTSIQPVTTSTNIINRSEIFKGSHEQKHTISKTAIKRKTTLSEYLSTTQPVSTATDPVSKIDENKYRLRKGKTRNYALMHSGNLIKRNVIKDIYQENNMLNPQEKQTDNSDSCSNSSSSIPKVIGSIIVVNDTDSIVSEDTSSQISSQTYDDKDGSETFAFKKARTSSSIGKTSDNLSKKTDLPLTEISDTPAESSTNVEKKYNLRKGKSAKSYALTHHGRVSSNKSVIVSLGKPEQDNTVCSSSDTDVKDTELCLQEYGGKMCIKPDVCSLKPDKDGSSTFVENCSSSIDTSVSSSNSLLMDALVNPTVFSDKSLLENWRKCNSQLNTKPELLEKK